MSDEPNLPFDPRNPQQEPPAETPPPAPPPVEPPTVIDGLTPPSPSGAPSVPPASPPPTPPPSVPTPPPAAPAPPAAAPPPAAPTPPPAAPTPPPVTPAPPATDPYGQPAVPTPPVTPPPVTPPPAAPSQPQYTPPQYTQPTTPQQTPPQYAAPQAPPAQSFAAPATTTFETATTESEGGGGKGPLIAIGVVLLAAIAGVGAFFAFGGDDGDDDEVVAETATTVPVATLPDQTASTVAGDTDTTEAPGTLPPDMTASVAELAESTVQILLLNNGIPVCSGSGTIIDERGTILTNAHVIEPGGGCDYQQIGIAITGDAGRPPELLYVADVYAYDPVVDLAVVRIATDLDGNPAPGPFKPVPVGDSDEVQIGDELRILGYPGIGGDTVTFTNGVVSGFASQNGIGERSWIKTDATIAGGNSGGAAFDDDGVLVGVPTQAAASSQGEVVDCRVITDTNGDGFLDDQDQCVPIGGFLNGLRPVNLAQPLIQQAESGAPISIQETPAAPAGTIDTSQIFVFNPGWSLEASDDAELPEFVRTATAGIDRLCIWFDWENLPDGALWDGVWQVDGELNEGFSFFSEEWAFGESGLNYWLCAIDETGLVAGLYEFIFYVEGEVIFYESFEITETPQPIHEVTFVNNSSTIVCYLFIAPLGAVNTGLDELGTEELFEVGTSKTFFVPQGSIVADAYDCDFNPVYQQYEGQMITGPTTIEITG